MKRLTTAEVVSLIIDSAGRGGLSSSEWHSSQLATLTRPERCYWLRDWPELDPQRYWDRMVPVHYEEPRLGWRKPLAQFATTNGGETVDNLWDIMVLPEEVGTVVVVGGFLPSLLPPRHKDHKLLWFRQRGLAEPGTWDAEILSAPERWSVAALEQLRSWEPPVEAVAA